MFRDPNFLTGKRSFLKTVHDPFRLAAPTEEKGGRCTAGGTGKRKVETNAPAARAAGREFHGKGKRQIPERTVPVC